ncbi:hypothetical protein TVAG_283840 [Trichomonas vaginalis G3]|uniref:Uncharacterized protein n=1 Tax=Trichomonas vaginalis (strain ATCC PRA-98 / G3) TaxID=412133 RepID=A2DET8_TRIV3|nr:hypothetical protein TVAGG3_0576620 [Trichomonas vaginalis G3]EAY21215.1 hypothetical protein TVAG_283840 [Trichomonas vaginalis G3]KAI5522250.1 hypothetical protein TVAGG3_0576620 [Trichomonas vaginalis G3]|eukprot:XP_001582201.1 hypothetical protein [Trichomonas vaginalis G3]
MSHVPPTESNLNPEEPKAPAPAPQFQQFQSQSKLLPVPIQIEERPRVRRRSEPLTQRVCYSSNPWMFMQKPAPQFQSQSKRDQDFEEGLNRLRKEYATAPIERKLFPDQKIKFMLECEISPVFSPLFSPS